MSAPITAAAPIAAAPTPTEIRINADIGFDDARSISVGGAIGV
jgi:hypothetical protein